jgi:hypothetical protein
LFPLFATSVVYTGGKFVAGIVDTGDKYATGIKNTSETGGKKFATGIVDTGGAPCLSNISANFRKKFGTVLMEYSGAEGKLIHEKNQKQKIL